MSTKITYNGEAFEVPVAANVTIQQHAATWEDFAEQTAALRALPDIFGPLEVGDAGQTVWATRMHDGYPNGDLEYTIFAPTDQDSASKRRARARRAVRA